MPGGRPKTSGKSHNRSSKTYLIAGRDQASTSIVLSVTGTSSVINYFKRPAEKSANVEITEEPLTSVPQVEIDDEEVENTNNIAPIFQRNKVKTTIESTKELISEKKAPDGRPKSTSSIYYKQETKYPWAYFNHSKNKWYCKTCKEHSKSGDPHWKALLCKHNEHPSQFFFDHENSSKHLNSIKNKQEILNVISKGTIVHQMVAVAETHSNAGRDGNRWLIGKFIKTTYFLTKKKWAVKFNFKNVIDFLDHVGDPDIKYHLRNAPRNSTYTSTFAVEEFLKLIGDHLASILLRDLNTSMDFMILVVKSTDDGD